MKVKISKSGIMKGLKWIFFLAMVILAFRVGLIHRLKESIRVLFKKSNTGICYIRIEFGLF